MSKVVPVDEFIDPEWYPGWRDLDPGPKVFDAVIPFEKKDEAGFWVLDFHHPYGFCPLSFGLLESGARLTQITAERIPLPPGRGLKVRMAGVHSYASEVPITSPWLIGERAKRAQQTIPAMIGSFQDDWAAAVEELKAGLERFESLDIASLDKGELAAYLGEAYDFCDRSWEIHFDLMYPLLANYAGFLGICAEFGIDASQAPALLQGEDTKIMQVDRALWDLADRAGEEGIGSIFASNEPETVAAALDADPAAATWLAEFREFLERDGWRTEGIVNVMMDPWILDPTSPLGTIKTFLAAEERFDFDAARAAAIAERDQLVAEIRDRLTVEERAVFDGALAAVRSANFVWWNEEHNYYIDLRSHIPIRLIGKAVVMAAGASDPEDVLFLFQQELMELAAGERQWSDLADLVVARRKFFEESTAKRGEMPKVLGTIPDAINDPVVSEIYGMGPAFFAALEADGETVTEMTGIPAAPGKVRGRVRVLLNARELHRIEPGEILVCEATSPNWTPAFGKIAACVCDTGGSLTHAAIVSREYRIPAVTGCAIATQVLKDGDLVEVDGDAGVVRIIERANTD